ncbi:MAG: radical SAM protein [Verrucomicrobia bacterium]|nr:radical SAM protein [Verrucomicrobiota bacterium]
MMATIESETKKRAPVKPLRPFNTAFGCPREFLDNQFVYVVISPRAGGLSVGVNMNPDKNCNFDCGYCEVDRKTPGRSQGLDVEVMAAELVQTLNRVQQGRLRQLPLYRNLPDELLQLRHVALSGDGEPTLCPNFAEAVQAVVHVRALGSFPFFKIVLITNTTGLDLPEVRYGLKFLTKRDEIWAKLDAGTQAYMDKVNKSEIPLEVILANILTLARERPVIIQSLFPQLNGQEPPEEEIQHYAQRLLELKNRGAQIPLVQIYSATRPTPHSECGHLPLKTLSRIAATVRKTTGLKVEVF